MAPARAETSELKKATKRGPRGMPPVPDKVALAGGLVGDAHAVHGIEGRAYWFFTDSSSYVAVDSS